LKHLDAVLKFSPTVIKGYTSVIKAMAYKKLEKDIGGLRVRRVFCTSEYLADEDRALIQRAFNAEVLDYYSSAESGLIAWECRQHVGYHINSDQLIVESVGQEKEGGPAASQEIVITNLSCYTMPWIRYQTGDAAVFAERPCPCGRSLPLLKKIVKRDLPKQL
jgi:phenylacetate-CoA ligase